MSDTYVYVYKCPECERDCKLWRDPAGVAQRTHAEPLCEFSKTEDLEELCATVESSFSPN